MTLAENTRSAGKGSAGAKNNNMSRTRPRQRQTAPVVGEDPVTPQITPGNLVSTVPDFLLAGAFLLSYLHHRQAPIPADELAILTLIEFFVMFSAFGWIGAMVRIGSRWRAMWSFIGMSVVAALYLVPLSYGIQAWWPLTGFLTLTLRRMIVLVLNPRPDDAMQQANARALAASGIAYLPILAVCAITAAICEPFQVIINPLYIAGGPYFMALAVSGLYDHAWIGRVTISNP